MIGTPPSKEERVISKFARYLNEPMGKIVLDNLEEGESFPSPSDGVPMHVTKKKEKLFFKSSMCETNGINEDSIS